MENLALGDQGAGHEVQLEQLLVALDHCLPELVIGKGLKYLGRVVLARSFYVDRAAEFVDSIVAPRVVGLQFLPLCELVTR